MTLPCICDDRQHGIGTALWHRAYCNWYDRRDRGQEFRAAAWAGSRTAL